MQEGSCGLGYIFPNYSTGWDTAAISDQSNEFDLSCGRCYEVQCRNEDVLDGFGEVLPRSKACYNTSESIVVRVTDACPCIKPDNQESNDRWCCGDDGSGAAHFDLSIWAFEKLAPIENGVINVEFRPVNCSYQPRYPSPAPDEPTPIEFDPPEGARPEGPECELHLTSMSVFLSCYCYSTCFRKA